MIIAWILLSFLVAFIGSDRKIGYWGTFGLSLLLSPIIGALFAIASQRLPKKANESLHPRVYNYYNQARKAYKKGNISLALHFLNNAYKLNPNSNLILFNLAVCYSEIKDKEKGFYYLDKALKNGYSNFAFIQQSSELKYLREQVEFKEFVENGYRLPIKDTVRNTKTDSISKLEKLAELKEKGFLTDEEYNTEKRKIILDY